MSSFTPQQQSEVEALAERAGIDFDEWERTHPLAKPVLGGVTFPQRAYLTVLAELQSLVAAVDHAAAEVADVTVEQIVGTPQITPGPKATDRQVDYIVDLIGARVRSGDASGFASFQGYVSDGRIDRGAIAGLTRDQASELITSLKGSY